jgi:hypothetical protein
MTERHSTDPKPAAGPPGIDHEIDVRHILEIGGWLIGVTLMSFAISWAFYRGLANFVKKSDPRPSPLVEAQAQAPPPGPLLQARPESELAVLRAREEARLEGWGWVDRGAGVAHVPIDRALEAVAREGLAPAPPPSASAETAN